MPPRKTTRNKLKTARKRSGFNFKYFFSNVVIVGMFMIVAGFVWSFMSNQNTEGKFTFDQAVNLPDLMVSSSYEKTTGHRINVEVLNGCAVPKLAALYRDYLRAEGIDVYRSDNADHSEYAKTIVIQRQGDPEIARGLAEIMGVSSEDIVISDSSDPVLDATIILGRDYDVLSSFRKALQYKTP
ncbi:MAG: LytR C-terminal domain-containing protein [Candidatus Marinimicrobia bacterium]|nr:LytR C-terminal domain-containing protein [Candidatus Neomarinimicrobiota bacterium]